MPELTDYLRASDGNGESVRLIVVADRGVGDLVFNNTTPTNWHTYFIAMAGTVDPVTDRFIEGEYVVFKGHLDGSAVTIDELAPGYVDNGNQEDDIIVIKPTTLWADIVADTMDGVTQAIIDADAATATALDAAADADTATGLANTATTNANTATGLANTATTNANNAATAATNAANATSWTQGTAVPTGGFNGNFYLRTTTYDVYQKIAGTWTIVANIKGATGATGSTGAAGANGSTWFNGSGAPSGGTGVNGDFYWDYTNYRVYSKAAGSWSLLSTISAADANAIKINGSATVTADIPFNANKLTGVKDPTNAQDAATKNYIDLRSKVLLSAVPAFYAYPSADIVNGSPVTTFTTVVFNSTAFNNGSAYSTSTGRFTPQVAGWYFFSAGVGVSNVNDQQVLHVTIEKNTVANVYDRVWSRTRQSGSGELWGGPTAAFYLNGSTDYVQVKVYNSTATTNVTAIPNTYFTGHLILAQ